MPDGEGKGSDKMGDGNVCLLLDSDDKRMDRKVVNGIAFFCTSLFSLVPRVVLPPPT
jgi:hypothetical protein